MALKKQPIGITAIIIQLPDACDPRHLWIVVDELPPEITKIIAVDFGVENPTPAMVERIEAALDHFSSCQPFSRITYLDTEGNRLGSMSSAAKGCSLNDRRWNDPRYYCQRGILAFRRDGLFGGLCAIIPGEITSPVPTKYVPPVIEPAVFVELPPVYAIQDPSELYTDPIRILPEELAHKDREDNIGMLLAFGAVSANLDTPPKP